MCVCVRRCWWYAVHGQTARPELVLAEIGWHSIRRGQTGGWRTRKNKSKPIRCTTKHDIDINSKAKKGGVIVLCHGEFTDRAIKRLDLRLPRSSPNQVGGGHGRVDADASAMVL